MSAVPNLDSAKCLSSTKNNCITPRGRKDRFIGATTAESRNMGLESSANGKVAKTSINMQGSFKVVQATNVGPET